MDCSSAMLCGLQLAGDLVTATGCERRRYESRAGAKLWSMMMMMMMMSVLIISVNASCVLHITNCRVCECV